MEQHLWTFRRGHGRGKQRFQFDGCAVRVLKMSSRIEDILELIRDGDRDADVALQGARRWAGGVLHTVDVISYLRQSSFVR